MKTRSALTTNQRSLTLLICGSVLGILVAVSDPYVSVTDDTTVVAWVNDTAIGKAQYSQALALYSQEKRSPTNPQDRTLILERLIEEELLVQKAITDGALRNNLGIRQRTLQTMLDSIQSESIATNGTNAESNGKALQGYIEQLRHTATIKWLNQQPTAAQAGQ
ncbi:MAG: hypothetical protein ACI8WL_001464 [Polaribacter sp.]|jgi:hypothetical protein|tara:strand:+ start:1691 stop:2182 length:492 start_codon:yes stop_codon:yes gene_type:complete